MSNTIRPSEISDVLLSQLKEIGAELKYEEVGKVLQVSDGVVRLYGLLNAEAAVAGATAPIHPGAEKYYKEIGILK